MPDAPTLFADGLLEASVHFGVVRLTLAQVGPDNKPVAAGQLVMPLAQVPGFANALVTVLQQVEARVKEAQAKQGAGTTSPPAASGGDVPGSFRFGS